MRFPQTVVAGSCGQPDVCAKNQACVLCKSSKPFSPPPATETRFLHVVLAALKFRPEWSKNQRSSCLLLIRIILEYCQCVDNIPSVTTDMLTRLTDLLKVCTALPTV